MIHSKFCRPRIFPWNNNLSSYQIDRVQDIGGDLTLNREKQFEVGRDGLLGYKKGTPSFSYSMKQFEYGSMNFWRKLANLEDPASASLDNSVDLEDLKSSKSDVSAYLTDDDNTFRGTIWFPKLRVNGFSINIGDPDAIIQRSLDLIGEDYKMLDGKYFRIQLSTSGVGNRVVTLSPAAVEWASGEYVFRVLRVRSGIVSELVKGTGTDQWSYATGDVTVRDCLSGDIVKIYYPSSTGYTVWTDNDADPDFLTADSADVYMKVGTGQKVYKLQSIDVNVKLDRTDYKEIGNTEIVQTGVKSKTVTVALNRFAEDFTLEKIFAGDTTYPFVDPRNFSENIQMMIKIYTDNTKTVFKMGYLINKLSPISLAASQAVEDYQKKDNSLESDNLLMSDDETEIAFS